MSSFANVLVWLIAVVAILQIANGGWSRLRQWLSAWFIGVPKAA